MAGASPGGGLVTPASPDAMRQSEEALTTPHVDHITDTERHEAPARAANEPEPSVSAGPTASGAVAVARTGASVARRGVNGFVARVPNTLRSTRAGARVALGALQTLPDSALRSLAATSVGIGFGLYVARTRRLAVVAGVMPAALIGAAIVARPGAPRLAPPAGRPALA